MKNDSKSGKKAPTPKVAGSSKVPKYQQQQADLALAPPKFPIKDRK